MSRLLLDPTGFHALLTNSGGETWYLNFQSRSVSQSIQAFLALSDIRSAAHSKTFAHRGNQAKAMPKLKGNVFEAAAWDPEATTTSTRDLLLGAQCLRLKAFDSLALDWRHTYCSDPACRNRGQGVSVSAFFCQPQRTLHPPKCQERTVKTVFEFDQPAPVVGLHSDTWFGYHFEGFLSLHS